MRAPVLGCHDVLSMFLAVIKKRTAAIATIAVPKTISASPAKLPNFWPGTEIARSAQEGAASWRNKSNFSTRKPKAITAMAVRTQARKVRSFAAWSLKFLIICPSYLRFAAGSMHLGKPLLECCFSKCGPPAGSAHLRVVRRIRLEEAR